MLCRDDNVLQQCAVRLYVLVIESWMLCRCCVGRLLCFCGYASYKALTAGCPSGDGHSGNTWLCSLASPAYPPPHTQSLTLPAPLRLAHADVFLTRALLFTVTACTISSSVRLRSRPLRCPGPLPIALRARAPPCSSRPRAPHTTDTHHRRVASIALHCSTACTHSTRARLVRTHSLAGPLWRREAGTQNGKRDACFLL